MERAKFRWWDVAKREGYPDHSDTVLAAMWRRDQEDYYFFAAYWDGAWHEWGDEQDIEVNTGLKVTKWSEIPEPKPPKKTSASNISEKSAIPVYVSIAKIGLSEDGKRALLAAGIYGVNDLCAAWDKVAAMPNLSAPDLIALSDAMTSHVP